MITALVILRTSPGDRVPSGSESGIRSTPIINDPKAFRVREYFASIGMKCGPLVGATFTIGGQASIFESYFDGSVRKRADGICYVSPDGVESNELPLRGLPVDICSVVASIVFPESAGISPGHP